MLSVGPYGDSIRDCQSRWRLILSLVRLIRDGFRVAPGLN